MTIRRLTAVDAPGVRNLNDQLGYPMSTEVVQSRIETILNRQDHAAFVAEKNGEVIGWIHVYVSHILESTNSFVEIGGLVVDEEQRGLGVGKALVKAVEEWTIQSGFDDIRLRSAIKRVEAHKFYESLGYRIVKTQMRFEKKLIHSE